MGEIAEMMIEAGIRGLDYESYCMELVAEEEARLERKRAKRKRLKAAKKARMKEAPHD